MNKINGFIIRCSVRGTPSLQEQLLGLLGVVLITLQLMLVVGCTGAKPNASEAALERPRNSSAQRVMAPGIVEPLGGDVELAAQEPGWIAEILVQEGQEVTKGTLLAQLEDNQQQAARRISEAEVAEAQANLDRVRRGSTSLEINQVREERDAAQARSLITADDAARTVRLKQKGSATEAELEKATRLAEADHATALALDARFKHLAAGSRKEDVQAAHARLEMARARLDQANAALERRKVTAPVDTTVLWSRYHSGEYYTPGSQAMFTLGNMTRYQIRADVDEIDVTRVTPAAPARIYSDAGAAPIAEGKVTWISPKMGRKNLDTESPTARGDTRIREILAEVPAKSPLLPGLRVWVEIPVTP